MMCPLRAMFARRLGFEPPTFVDMLASGRQVERLWLPNTPHPLLLEEMPDLNRIAATLYPGRERRQLWTPVELLYIRHSTLAWLFNTLLPGGPPTLSSQIFCNFMLGITMPAALFNEKWRNVATTGLTFSGAGSLWGDGEHLNLAFPRGLHFYFSPLDFPYKICRDGVTQISDVWSLLHLD